MKKIIALALALLLSLGVFSGCALVEKDDSNVVIANVNGTPILKSDFNDVYDYYYYMYINYYGVDASTAESYIDKNDILEGLIEEELLSQLAEKEQFFVYTDEDREAAKKIIDEDKESYIDSFVEEYTAALKGQEIKGKKDGESDADYFKRVAEEKYQANLKENDTSYEQMIEDQLKTAALDKYKESKLKDVVVYEADMLTHYNEIYEEQKQELSTDKKFVDAWNGQQITTTAGSQTTYDIIATYRKGYSVVQHILVEFEEVDVQTLSGYYQTMSEYDEEINDRTAKLKDEKDEAKIKEHNDAITSAKAKKADVKKKYDDALKAAQAKIQAKTDEIYNSVKDADEAKFIEVMIEKTDDDGMKTEEAAKKGYLVGPSDGMVTEFSNAATALEAGKVSQPVATYYGYHIIRSIKKLPEGKVAFEDLKDEINKKLTDEKKSKEWTTMLEAWKKEADIKKYESRL